MEWSSNRFSSARDSQDSAIGSFRALPQHDSQGSELMHIATQDVFSQEIITPKNDVKKTSSIFDKWKTKQATKKGDTNSVHGWFGNTPNDNLAGLGRWDSKSSINSISHSDQYLGNGRKPVVNDEREMLDYLVTFVRQSNNEVKSTLMHLMDQFGAYKEVSSTNLFKSISTFMEKISAHEDRMEKIITDQNINKSNMNDLQREVIEKDSKISNLEIQLSSTKLDQLQGFTGVVRSEIQSLQAQLLDKIHILQNDSKECLRQHQDFAEEYQARNSLWEERFAEQNKATKYELKESEKRISTKISGFVQKLESKQTTQYKQSKKEFGQMLEDCFGNRFEEVFSTSISKELLQEQTNKILQEFQRQIKSTVQSLEGTLKSELKKILSERANTTKMVVTHAGTSTEDVLRKTTSLNDPTDAVSFEKSLDKFKQPSLNQCVNIKRAQYMPTCYQGPNNYDPYRFNAPNTMLPRQDFNQSNQPSTASYLYNETGIKSWVSNSVYSDTNGNDFSRNSEIEQNFEKTLHNLNEHAPSYQHSHFNGGGVVPRRKQENAVAPFVSPLPPANSNYMSKKGPSPCAIVAPQRQACSNSSVRPPSQSPKNKGQLQQESLPLCSIQNTKNKKRKSVNKRKCYQKNSPIEGLNPASDPSRPVQKEYGMPASPCRPLTRNAKYQKNSPIEGLNPASNPSRPVPKEYGMPASPCRPMTRNAKYLSNLPTNKCNIKLVDIKKVAYDAYNFDETDQMPIRQVTPATKAKMTQLYRNVYTPARKQLPKTKMSPAVTEVTDSSSPAIPVMELKLKRRVRTPMRVFKERRLNAEPRHNWQNRIQGNDLLDDMSN